ncbi:MAG: hypothetical protein IPO94_12485 [Saprospiraceae bacterium]|nr:hypothetical protein [Saprospiraceae bacterium]
MKFGGEEYVLTEGDTFNSCGRRTFHRNNEAGEVVDVFSPIRQDYL